MNESVVKRPSSTVVLVRAGSSAPEVFMVRRHANSPFGAVYAFPGGVVDPGDAEVHAFCDAYDDGVASRHLGIERGGLDYYVAAIRELFEETGVLLADLSGIDEDMSVIRDGLNDGSGNWADFVARNELRLQCGHLHYFDHKSTPPQIPEQYSTRFFLAQLPAGQEAAHCGGEVTESLWATVDDILAAGQHGDIKLLSPTAKTLKRIGQHRSLDELMKWGAASAERAVPA